MADSLERDRDVIKLNDPRDCPLWCIQVRNALRTRRCEQAILPNFLEPTRKTAVQILEAEGWGPEECKDIKLISDKLRTEKAIYETAKAESVGVINSRIHCNRLNLLKGHTTAQALWSAIRQEFDITRASEIGSIAARVISKSFMEFATIEKYCRAYQETYDDIAFATSMVSCFVKNPEPDHFSAVNQILAGSQDRSITFGGGEPEFRLVGYLDSDWAGDHADRNSTLGFVFSLNRGPISYGSKNKRL